VDNVKFVETHKNVWEERLISFI